MSKEVNVKNFRTSQPYEWTEPQLMNVWCGKIISWHNSKAKNESVKEHLLGRLSTPLVPLLCATDVAIDLVAFPAKSVVWITTKPLLKDKLPLTFKGIMLTAWKVFIVALMTPVFTALMLINPYWAAGLYFKLTLKKQESNQQAPGNNTNNSTKPQNPVKEDQTKPKTEQPDSSGHSGYAHTNKPRPLPTPPVKHTSPPPPPLPPSQNSTPQPSATPQPTPSPWPTPPSSPSLNSSSSQPLTMPSPVPSSNSNGTQNSLKPVPKNSHTPPPDDVTTAMFKKINTIKPTIQSSDDKKSSDDAEWDEVDNQKREQLEKEEQAKKQKVAKPIITSVLPQVVEASSTPSTPCENTKPDNSITNKKKLFEQPKEKTADQLKEEATKNAKALKDKEIADKMAEEQNQLNDKCKANEGQKLPKGMLKIRNKKTVISSSDDESD